MNNVCQFGNHQQRNIISLCFSTKCKEKRECCQICVDQLHKDHTDQLTDIDYLLNYIKTESKKPSLLQPQVSQRLQVLQKVLNCLGDLTKLIGEEMRKLSSMNVQQICKDIGNSYNILSQDFQGLNNQKWNQLIEDMLTNLFIHKCYILQKDATGALSQSLVSIQDKFSQLKQQLGSIRVGKEWFETFKESQRIEGHTDIVRGIDICKQRNLLASGSVDKSVKLWCLKNNKIMKTFTHSGEVQDVVFSKQGNLLAFGGSGDYSIQLLDISDLEKNPIVTKLCGHSGDIYRLIFSQNSQHLISSSKENQIKIWDLNAKKEAFQLNSESQAHGIAIKGDSTIIVSNSEDGKLRIWNFQEKKLHCSEPAHNKGSGIQFSDDQKMIVSSGFDGLIKLWNLEQVNNQNKLTLTKEWKAANNCIWAVSFSSFSGYIISICNQDKEIKISDTQTSNAVKSFKSKSTNEQYIDFIMVRHLVSVAVSQDAKIIAYGEDNNIIVWRQGM